jgi:CBS domain-containing protein
LTEVGVKTVPDFNLTYLDGPIAFSLEEAPKPTTSANTDANKVDETVTPAPTTIGGNVPDPTFRVGRLASANQKPLGVAPDCPLKEVITLMLTNDYSQLPVMQGERTVKGMVSWSSIGVRLALNREASAARDCMEPAHEVSADDSIFTAIGAIIQHQYVLVRGGDGTVTGIVTATDLSVQFQQLAEPFLLLGEVENHIRRLIGGKFTAAELKAVRDDNDSDREVESVADLTFGEYVRLLENPAQWERLSLGVDRATFVKELDKIRGIRNDVMHFDPDGITEADLQALRRFVGFLQRLRDIGAT